MEAYYLIKTGAAQTAFEKRALQLPEPAAHEVQLEVEAFGLNFADVMARYGMYKEAPPMPSVLGYEVVGRIVKTGADVTNVQPGQRVVACTRFGGYATHANTNAKAVAVIPDNMPAGEAAALATQYATAWYAAEECIKLRAGEHVLVHAAAGGVGTALVQLAKRRGCIVYGTTGSDSKFEYLKNNGVDHPVNYSTGNFAEQIRALRNGKGVDVVFDAVGGKTFKQGMQLLEAGGRMVTFGAAERLGRRNIFSALGLVFGFGFYHPIALLFPSKSITGINMLRIADHKPEILKECLEQVAKLTAAGELKPYCGKVFSADQIADAHSWLESRKSVGKVVCVW